MQYLWASAVRRWMRLAWRWSTDRWEFYRVCAQVESAATFSLTLFFFFFRWCLMWTMEPDGCRFAPTVSCCATEGGTSCRPGKPNTAWAWAWMGEVILQRILTHSQPLLKPTTPCIWADSQVRPSADPIPRLVSICVRVQPTSSNFSWSLTVDVRQNCLSISSRFRGCLRNLQLVRSHMSNTLDLSSAHFLLGVTPYSCPAT